MNNISSPPSSVDSESSDNIPRVVFLSLIAALGGFLFGFDSGVINGTVDALQNEFRSDSVGTGFNVASMLLGSALGAFFAGNFADKVGRRPAMILTALAFIVSAWGSGISENSVEFVIYRILGGLAVGAASILTPAYVSEIAPARIRGALATLQQLMIVTGLFVAFLNNYLIALAAGSAGSPFWLEFDAWQWMFWMELIPAAVFLISLLVIPESPRFLMAAGKERQARTVLRSIMDPRQVEEKIEDIRSTLGHGRARLLRALVTPSGKLHPLLWVGLGLAALQQFTGINVVFYYGGTLWQAAGLDEQSALLINVITGSVNVLFTFVAISLVDRVGRKPLLLVGSLGQAAMLGVMALSFGVSETSTAGSLSMDGSTALVALMAANAYIAFFAFSWGPVMWVMLGEMFPNHFRGAALSVCGLVQWLANFLITMTFPILLASIGLALSYAIYAAFGVVAFAFVRYFVAETKGRTLEEISRQAQSTA